MTFLLVSAAILVSLSFLAGIAVGESQGKGARARKRDVDKARKALKRIARAVDTNALYLVGDPVASPLMDDIRSEIRNYYEGVA